ncbi:hypothetical protein M8037_06175 [Sinorhizobium meliloti]|uniref:hypothetical protein n=1 Tax=Rhizobium meliloti TaxID=382 RepID=UPI0020732C69|nr:hypothetical protein [Sinorhizobium meliloti]MCM5688420.1 hypothetical protein [Sinorhizobium meliloti]
MVGDRAGAMLGVMDEAVILDEAQRSSRANLKTMTMALRGFAKLFDPRVLGIDTE